MFHCFSRHLLLLPPCTPKSASRWSSACPNNSRILVTKIDGQSYRDDYTVVSRGLRIGRIRKNPGLSARVDQWSWGCNVYGQPTLDGDNGPGTNFKDCETKFKIASARIRARLAHFRHREGA